MGVFFRSSPTLRHSFATYYSSQVLISYIARHPEQDQLGHTDLRTTQIYTHILQFSDNFMVSTLSRL
jgi:site-specific recombinase XerD